MLRTAFFMAISLCASYAVVAYTKALEEILTKLKASGGTSTKVNNIKSLP